MPNHPALEFLNTLPIAGEDHLRTIDDLQKLMTQTGLVKPADDNPWRFNDKADPLVPAVKRFREQLRSAVEAVYAGRSAPGQATEEIHNLAEGPTPEGDRITNPRALLTLLAQAARDLLDNHASQIRKQRAPQGEIYVLATVG
jgi:hypothetical protein